MPIIEIKNFFIYQQIINGLMDAVLLQMQHVDG